MTTAESIEIIEAINSRQIFTLPKSKLEQFISALGTSNAHEHFGVEELAGYRRTIETALHARFSEDQESQPNRVAVKITGSAKNNVFVGCNVNGGVEINKNAEGNKFIQTEITSREIPNPTTEPASNKPPDRIEQKEWYQRPVGIIGLTIFAGIIIAFAIYLIKKHLGIPL